MHLLVTGGTGYIGSHTAVELLNMGHDVTIIDNLCNSKAEVLRRIEHITNKQCTFYKASILDKKALADIFNAKPIDAVIHFAALKAVGESTRHPLKYYENNVTGTLHLLSAMKEASVKTMVFSSSATVYGVPDEVPVKEDASLKPATNPYGATKQMIERILEDEYQADSSWNISILRYFNPVGAHPAGLLGEDPNGIPNNLMPYILQVASGRLECLNIFGTDYPTPDGSGVRDYIHVTDLALGHVAALNTHSKDTGINIYNLGTGKGHSVLEVVSAFEKISGLKIPVRLAARRTGDIATIYADASKANRQLQWHAKQSLKEMIEDSWNWQQKNPDGYE